MNYRYTCQCCRFKCNKDTLAENHYCRRKLGDELRCDTLFCKRK